MDLLGEEKNKKNKKTKGQKIVLTMLIVSIISFIIIIIALMLLNGQKSQKQYSLLINGTTVTTESIGLIQLESGKTFIPLKTIAKELGYKYYNGEFKIAGEDTNKGYIDNGTNIVQFFADSLEIYKSKEDASAGKAYYKLENKIIENNENLYVCLEDLSVSLNLITYYSEKENKTIIQTADNWITAQATFFEESGYAPSQEEKNLNALAYGYLIVTKDEKYGVINLSGEEIIGNKYSNIIFDEYTGNFIVYNTNGKAGIITAKSQETVNMQYDDIEILNYKPLLYKVKKQDDCGIIKENGNLLAEIIYDSIGYPENKALGINYTLIIPEINENIPESIVVCKNNKYGLIEAETGEQILECSLNAIYCITYDGKDYYVIEKDNKEQDYLENYIKSINSMRVNING